MHVGMLKACVECQTEFETRASGARYCSDVCHFNHCVIKSNGCWDWKRKGNTHGYIRVTFADDRRILAHRFSYELFIGHVPDSLFVLHTCDNPRCTNPKHLFLGTHKDNTQDCLKKGRFKQPPISYFKVNPSVIPRGVEHHSAKLSESEVKYIFKSKQKAGILGIQFGVRRQVIWMIRTKRIWKHITNKM
jgi:hypothetical protein